MPGTNEFSNKNSSLYSSAYVGKDSRPEEFGFIWNIIHRDENRRGWNPEDINISDMWLFKAPPWPLFRSSFDFRQSSKKNPKSPRLAAFCSPSAPLYYSLRFFSSRVFLSKQQLQSEERVHVL